MNSFEISASHIEEITGGSVLVFPTETIYGLGCNAVNAAAVRRVFEIKGRAPSQPPPILIANGTQLEMMVKNVSPIANALMKAFWPGELTLILEANVGLPETICGKSGDIQTIGVRMTGHEIAQAICQATGPLVATSANRSGATGRAAMPRTLEEVDPQIRENVDICFEGTATCGRPSTIVDCTRERKIVVLREGAIETEVLKTALREIGEAILVIQ